MAFLALAIVGFIGIELAHSLPKFEPAGLQIWFSCVCAVRICDIIVIIINNRVRLVDPRRRTKYVALATLLSVCSALIGITAVSATISSDIMANVSVNLVLEVAFYTTFVPLLVFYFSFLAPIGCCCCCSIFMVCQTTQADQEDENIVQSGNRAANLTQEQHLPQNANPMRQKITHGTWKWFQQTFATDDTEECVLCLNAYETTDILDKLPCGHYFHQNCINNVLQNGTCPICRQPINDAHDLHKIIA